MFGAVQNLIDNPMTEIEILMEVLLAKFHRFSVSQARLCTQNKLPSPAIVQGSMIFGELYLIGSGGSISCKKLRSEEFQSLFPKKFVKKQ